MKSLVYQSVKKKTDNMNEEITDSKKTKNHQIENLKKNSYLCGLDHNDDHLQNKIIS